MEENNQKRLSKLIYKYLILTLKLLPFIIAILYLTHAIVFALGVDLFFFGYIAHTSILSWLFLYLSSFAFKYCIRHRLPLYYIAVNDTLQVSDYYLKFPMETPEWILLNIGIAVLFTLLYIYLKFKK